MLYNLPEEIIRKIYEYDDTYKLKYDLIVQNIPRIFNSYNRYIHHYLFHNDLYFNINLQVKNIFHFIKSSNKQINKDSIKII